MKKSVKRSLAIGAGVLVVVGGAWGYTTLKGATPDIDPSKLATVERGTMTRSVVATGKIEPITKVEIKSKANGIIERLNVDVDQVVGPATCSSSSTGKPARQVRRRSNLRAAKAAEVAAGRA
jgi:HlyD family secretion protein